MKKFYWTFLLANLCWSIIVSGQQIERVLPREFKVFSLPYPTNTPFHEVKFSYGSLRDGNWIQFYEVDGNKFKIARVWSTKNGKIDGREFVIDLMQRLDRINYYDDGVLSASAIFYDNGKIKDSTSYSSDMRVVYSKSWDENGAVKRENTGVQETVWYANGNVRLQKEYNAEGLTHGVVRYKNESGRILYEDKWINGRPADRSKFKKLSREMRDLIEYRGYIGN